MEEEEFGLTKRDKKILYKILASSEGEKNSEANEGASINCKEGQVRVTGADDRDNSVKVHDGDNESGSGSGEGNVGGTPETGNEYEAKGVSGESLVVREPPSIPNVVEYHLKVKTPSSILKNRQGETPEVNKKSNKLSIAKEEKLRKELSEMALENKGLEASAELPQTFQVKYLGSHDARGLWGIKHTRKPVDNMVSAARSLPAGTILPFIKLAVSKEGVRLLPLGKKRHDAGISKTFSIDTISYGVQDLVYTRVFSMIVVREIGQNQGISPFECHGFVCESRHHARQLTYALASAFQIYSMNVKAQGKSEETAINIKKRFAIDLRTPEEIEAELTLDSEA